MVIIEITGIIVLIVAIVLIVRIVRIALIVVIVIIVLIVRIVLIVLTNPDPKFQNSKAPCCLPHKFFRHPSLPRVLLLSQPGQLRCSPGPCFGGEYGYYYCYYCLI